MKPRRFLFALRAIRRSLPRHVTYEALERLQPAWEAQQTPQAEPQVGKNPQQFEAALRADSKDSQQ